VLDAGDAYTGGMRSSPRDPLWDPKGQPCVLYVNVIQQDGSTPHSKEPAIFQCHQMQNAK
jgi:hypothetical protein